MRSGGQVPRSEVRSPRGSHRGWTGGSRFAASAMARRGSPRGRMPRRAVSSSAASSALAYVGGKAGAANSKKSPIDIGWVSDETAITGHPGNTAGVKAAVALINNNLGGVAGGHPVKLVPLLHHDLRLAGRAVRPADAQQPGRQGGRRRASS